MSNNVGRTWQPNDAHILLFLFLRLDLDLDLDAGLRESTQGPFNHPSTVDVSSKNTAQ